MKPRRSPHPDPWHLYPESGSEIDIVHVLIALLPPEVVKRLVVPHSLDQYPLGLAPLVLVDPSV
jgi:hypothetical protein